jgi:hypothetical protein
LTTVDRERSQARRTPSPRGDLRVGCSGWSYKDWRGIIYPEELPQRLWFEHYQGLFDTVELNSTFYRLPSTKAVDHWADVARPGFLYAVRRGSTRTCSTYCGATVPHCACTTCSPTIPSS